MAKLFRHFFRALRRLGWATTTKLVAMYLIDLAGFAPKTYRIRPPGSAIPVSIRSRTSDINVFFQVFTGAYEHAVEGELKGLIVDCGANVGFAAVYLLDRFPSCHVVAIEPEPGNFSCLVENTRRFGDRVVAVRSGVWSHPARLGLRERGFGDGREWSQQVMEVDTDDPDGFDAIDIPTIVKLARADRIALLKVDIEGAEVVIFGDRRHGALDWLAHVDNIAIELHDGTVFGQATEAFEESTKDFAGERFDAGELRIIRNMARAKPALL
ncbi:FkbM family methyltransferase [Devosia sp.]|uniref:FkbM family methyltransferase n=1 Tax=Devosia sp. TaxID=1871048 RepID=UPI002624AD0F|nr:FkbM family methyltransferase [Devosia sp.]